MCIAISVSSILEKISNTMSNLALSTSTVGISGNESGNSSCAKVDSTRFSISIIVDEMNAYLMRYTRKEVRIIWL